MSEIERIIYGKYDKSNIVGCEVSDGSVELFIQDKEGNVTTETKPYKYWFTTSQYFKSGLEKLNGNLPLKYLAKFDTESEYRSARESIKSYKVYSPYNLKEQAMVYHGFTYYKNLKVEDVTALSFDIETTTLNHNDKAKILLISNTYRKNNKIHRKLFSYDDYQSQGQMLEDWCDFVKKIDPSIILGHNVFSFDLPYMAYIANQECVDLSLGRDDSHLKFASYQSKMRKDASQSYSYNNAEIYGREIVDTMFLAIKYDIGRKYESYGLKNIISQEGLEVEGRQFYDASKIKDNYKNPDEWAKIKEYAKHDADDSLALFDLMIPSQFYLNRTVPKPLQAIVNTATGTQINSILARSYIQEKHSLPTSDKKQEYIGAISYGNPGLHKNVFKIDVASLYPSIILQYNIYDKKKDPKANFLKMVKYLTEERLKNKKLGKTDRYYKDLEQAQKIVINSCYGMLGANGLIFNSPENASKITAYGRDIIKTAIKWASGEDYQENNT